jgi:putative SOS response-associated peptidase YedK
MAHFLLLPYVIRTCSVIVRPANDLIAPIQNRMPVIRDRRAWPKWLGEQPQETEDILAEAMTGGPAAVEL